MQESKGNLREMIDLCKIGKMHTEALAAITGLDRFRQYQTDLTHLDSIKRTGNNTITFVFTHPIILVDTSVYKLDPFRHWSNITQNPTILEYDGPRWAIKNITVGSVYDETFLRTYFLLAHAN